MSAPNFVGRESDLSQIKDHFWNVMLARPCVFLIEGIAGMGKTRLVKEIEARFIPNSMRVALGKCYEDTTQPYAPFLSLLTYFEEEQILDDSGTSFLHVLTGRAAPSVDISASPGTEHAQLLYMSVTQAVITLASRRPLLFVIEDLHWADPSTLDLIDYLAFALAAPAAVPLFLVATYRPVEPDSRLGELLARLRRESAVRSLELSGLDESETRRLLRELGVRRPTQQLTQAVYEATQGLPLFIEEALNNLVRQGALYESGGALSIRSEAMTSIELPADLLNAISTRLGFLPSACQFPLTLAALLGETFDAEILQMIITLDAAEIDEALEAGIEHGVLLRENSHFRFAHPLLRHAFYNRLEPAGRRNYHLQIAQTLERLYAEDLEPYILVLAGPLAEPETVMAYTQQAAARAFAMFAWREAARYYEAALGTPGSLRTSSPKRAQTTSQI